MVRDNCELSSSLTWCPGDAETLGEAVDSVTASCNITAAPGSPNSMGHRRAGTPGCWETQAWQRFPLKPSKICTFPAPLCFSLWPCFSSHQKPNLMDGCTSQACLLGEEGPSTSQSRSAQGRGNPTPSLAAACSSFLSDPDRLCSQIAERSPAVEHPVGALGSKD